MTREENKDFSTLIKLELIWWLVTMVILIAVIYPIYVSATEYPFLTPNIVFILTFVTFTRYLFFLKLTLFRFVQWVKVVLFLVCIPILIYIFQELNMFIRFADEIGIQSLFLELTESRQSVLIEYTKTEFLFFGVAGFISALVFPFRMLISFWRTHNRGTI